MAKSAKASSADEAPQPAKSNKKIIILLVVGVLLAAAVAAGGTWFFLNGSQEQTQEEASAPKKKQALYVKLRTMGGKPSFISNFYEDNGRQRFLQIYAEALTRDPAIEEALKKHMPMIVHKLSSLFADQSFQDLQTAEGREQLRALATKTVQDVMQAETGQPGVEQVFFTNFVMQ